MSLTCQCFSWFDNLTSASLVTHRPIKRKQKCVRRTHSYTRDPEKRNIRNPSGLHSVQDVAPCFGAYVPSHWLQRVPEWYCMFQKIFLAQYELEWKMRSKTIVAGKKKKKVHYSAQETNERKAWTHKEQMCFSHSAPLLLYHRVPRTGISMEQP